MSGYRMTHNPAHETNGNCDVIEPAISFKNEGACGGRTRVEKILLFLVLVFVLTIVGLVIALVMVNREKEEEPLIASSEICNTGDCVQAAARLLENMDFTADPCEDFYTYSCGNWKKINVIPEDTNRQHVFKLLGDGIQVINKYLLEDENSYRDVEAIRKAKDLYASCTDIDKIENLTKSVAIPLLEELGGWPTLGSNPGGNWNPATFDLVRLLVTLRKYNNRPLVNLHTGPDLKDSTNRIIYIDQPSFGLPGRDYYLDPNLQHMRDAYVTFAKSVAELFGADPTTAEADMRAMLELETELANITMKAEERRDNELLYNKMTIDQMAQNFTEPSASEEIQFQWLNFVQGIMGIDGVDIAINGTEHVVVRSLPYYSKLFDVVRRHPPRSVANLLIWSIMKNRVRNLPQKFNDLVKDYNKAVFGTTTDRPRWRTCESFTVSELGMAVGHMFVKQTFDESAKTVALEMIQTIREAFTELLDELEWMDENTKALAREKAKAMKEWIGYPDYVLDVDEIDKIYENVTVSRDRFFENVLNNLNLISVDSLKDLREEYNKSIWTTPPSTVNAFYSPIRNNIMFPAGILQPPFYSKNQPKSMNYGGIGVVIGHEITHGFDDRGRQYDKDGNLVEWWDESIINNFKEKAQCFVDQYGEFVSPEANMTVNGINTQGENMADNGGLKESFKAYRKWVEAQGKEEPGLPGVDFSHNQLFFINFAQIWCNNIRTEYAIKSINVGVHSPGQFRVIGTLQNSPDFAKAFKCSSSSYMNRQKKCYVW